MTTVLAACSNGTLVSATTQAGSTSRTSAARSTHSPPAVDLLATPGGWVPVDLGQAQLSVPESFSVVYPNEIECEAPSPIGVLIVRPRSPETTGGCPMRRPVRPNLTTVYLIAVSRTQMTYGSEPATRVNGVQAYLAFGSPSALGYFVPALGIEAYGYGPLAKRVLDTLTRSPRSVALAAGPVPEVPASWKAVSFSGVQAAVPSSWLITRVSMAVGSCGGPAPNVSIIEYGTYGGDHAGAVLSSDAFPFDVICPFVPPSYSAIPPREGLRIDGGPYAPAVSSTSAPCLDLRTLAVCPAASPPYSILRLAVSVPGHSEPVIVSIGLAGGGTVARTILYSLRPA